MGCTGRELVEALVARGGVGRPWEVARAQGRRSACQEEEGCGGGQNEAGG